jgi:hypothetical protein
MAGMVDLGKVVGDNGQGVPTGGAAGTYLRKLSSSDYDTEWENLSVDDRPTAGSSNPVKSGGVENELLKLQNGIAIVVDGNKSAVSVAIGQFVFLKNSTISGCSDGLYTAAKAIPANTAINGTYLSAEPSGGLNVLNDGLKNTLRYAGISLGGSTVGPFTATLPYESAWYIAFTHRYTGGNNAAEGVYMITTSAIGSGSIVVTPIRAMTGSGMGLMGDVVDGDFILTLDTGTATYVYAKIYKI